MRIVHVLASYEVGGGEILACRLAAQQRLQGYDVHVVALSSSGLLRARFADAAVAAHVVEKKEGFDLSLFARLAIFFGYLRPQVVHTHNPQSPVYA
ncbi:MAG: glycosyltransferase, partial [Deltaproteobacteria bacterium]|nr:glycosyltransferase [Deltaproteobacteria bacterium]